MKKNKTILVETLNGNLSYPKGKFEKKKDKTILDCAMRELEEETNIKPEQIKVIPNIILSEIKNNIKCTIQYYIGLINESPLTNEYKLDSTKEISIVKWYDFDSIERLEKLKQTRKEVFNQLRQILKF